jgi:hypothetical protein
MAKNKKTASSGETPTTERKERGPRREREYRFEVVDFDGKVDSLHLVLTHRESANIVKDWLNAQTEMTADGQKYRYVELIVTE